FAPAPIPSTQLIDRYLVAAELAGITPVLLLNKADLIDAELEVYFADIEGIYRDLGYDFLRASATTATGLEALHQRLKEKTSVFVGQSGVGKSSLVNAQLPDAKLSTQGLSSTTGLGQHTTTTALLSHLPKGGRLIDSPGIREFGLWQIDEHELLTGYPELANLAGECRFRNCTHRHEPGCAWQNAVTEGKAHAERLANFFRIADTLDAHQRQRYHD